MLGQAQTPYRRLLGIAATAFVVLAVPAVGGADPTTSADALRREDASLAAQSHTALLSLYSLESRLGAARARLAALEEQERRLRAERASLGRQLTVARAGVAISQRRLAARLRLLYEQGDVTTIEVVLGSKTLDDAITGLDNIGRAASLDERVLAQVKSANVRLGLATRAADARAARLAASRREASATAASLVQAQAERRAYLGRLASQRRLKATQIDRLQAQARAARERAQALAAAPAAVGTAPVATVAPEAALAPGPAPAAPVEEAAAAPGRTLTVTTTGYSMSGTTATGLAVGWGVAAVDPSVIPLGTTMTVPGYGTAVAADTGGAVSGATVDLWFPTPAQALAWGRRVVTIVVS